MLNEQILDALRAINVPEDKARAAAISVTEYEPKIQALDARIQAIDLKITVLEGKVTLVQWMLGVVLAMQIAVIVKLFHIG